NNHETMTDDPRLGDIITHEEPVGQKPAAVALLGFPYDEGVSRNGGRTGAREGPSTLRTLYKRMGTVVNPEYDIDLRTIGVHDVGDIDPDHPLEEAHSRLRARVSNLLSIKGVVPFVVGGGNDQSFPNGSALIESCEGQSVGVINIDAHLDVRPLKEGKTHSGSPFRQLMEESGLEPQRFVEFAAQGNQCSATHVKYLTEKGGKIHWLSSLRSSDRPVVQVFREIIDHLGDNVFVSFDIDAISGADCPGVSAVGTIGITAQEALDICYAAGRHPKVRLFDLSEYNPQVEAYRTGRLVANMFYFFSMGLAQRIKDGKK
ncbi:putative arginase, partial [Planoprotostelium fungivorum]